MLIDTYVSAYYHVPKPKLDHMGLGRYVALAPGTLRMMAGKKLFFYYEEDFVGEVIGRICDETGIEAHLKRVGLTDLPNSVAAERIAANAAWPGDTLYRKFGKKEKGIAHFLNLCDGAANRPYRDNLSIWLSKIDLVNETLSAPETAGSQIIAWVDIGVSKLNYVRSNWNFAREMVSTGKLYHYTSNMRFQGGKLPLNASVLGAEFSVWRELGIKFFDALQSTANSSYPHDEETILKLVHDNSPELFHTLGRPGEGRIGQAQYLLRRLSSS